MDANLLRFHVQGSARAPYRVTFEGQGADLRAFCSCPAGSKGGLFCKHAAALLVGDVTKLVEPSDCVEFLRQIAVGSDLILKAIAHNPKPPRVSAPSVDAESLQHVLDLAAQRIESVNAVGRIEPYLDDGEALFVYMRLKNGRIRRTASLELYFEPIAWDLCVTIDGGLERRNVRPRVRPWGLRGKDVRTKTWVHLGEAAAAFIAELDAMVEQAGA